MISHKSFVFKCILYFFIGFFVSHIFVVSQNMQKLSKFSSQKPFLVPKTSGQILQPMNAWLLFVIPQKFQAWNRSGLSTKVDETAVIKPIRRMSNYI